MFSDDAELVEKIATSLREDTGKPIIVDLADLDLLDSEAASILRRVGNRSGISIEGVEILLQTAIDTAERHDIQRG